MLPSIPNLIYLGLDYYLGFLRIWMKTTTSSIDNHKEPSFSFAISHVVVVYVIPQLKENWSKELTSSLLLLDFDLILDHAQSDLSLRYCSSHALPLPPLRIPIANESIMLQIDSKFRHTSYLIARPSIHSR